jgi:DNA-binding transcriptional MerR regulator
LLFVLSFHSPSSSAVMPLPNIPAKRYFTIGEVGDLCSVKPHVLRYWEQEFEQLKPVKRRGNRRYYQHHEVAMVRRIRELLYEQGYTISGARNQLQQLETKAPVDEGLQNLSFPPATIAAPKGDSDSQTQGSAELQPGSAPTAELDSIRRLRSELMVIRQLLVA